MQKTHNIKAKFMTLLAFASIAVGGIIAVFLAKGCFSPFSSTKISSLPETEDPDENVIFEAPEKLHNGAIKSCLESWPDGSDKLVEYYLIKEGVKTLVKRIKYRKSGDNILEIDYYYESGKTITKEQQWFENGEKQFEFYKEDNKFHGEFMEYWNNGCLKIKGQHENSKKEGIWHTWYITGIRESTFGFSNGLTQGTYTKWNEIGSLIIKGSYEKGKRTGEWINYETSEINEQNDLKETAVEEK